MRKCLFGLPALVTLASFVMVGSVVAMEVPAPSITQAPALTRIDVDPTPTNVIAPMPPRRADAQRVAVRPVSSQPRVAAYQPARAVPSQPARAVCPTPRCGPLMMIGVTY